MSSRTLAGRYELLEKVGDGGMAVVYRARDKLLNRYVAVKILKPDFSKDVKVIESFRRESQAAASLSSQYIVNVYDVGREGSINYIVMELIEGKVLADVIKERGPLAPREAVHITKQIAAALSHAHKNQIIHRDVKPHNILLTADGTAKITDFGIAKAVNSSTIVGQTGTVMGSVHYFSPEQARGGYVDEKSDIYSLGIVLYEMLTGKVPFDADNPVAVAMKHMNEEMIPPSALVEGVPAELEAIILKATDKYQINRYRSADEMLEALNAATFSSIGTSIYPRTTGLESGVTINLVNESGVDLDSDEGGQMRSTKNSAKDKGQKVKKKFKWNKLKVAAIIAALVVAFPLSQAILWGFDTITAPKEVEVIDLTGMTVEEAREALEKLDLSLEISDEVSSADFDEGEIVSQDPEEGMVVKAGKTIKVNVSEGTPKGTIPNVVGKTEKDAVFMLENYGYDEGLVSEEYSEDVPEGMIIEQSPAAGTEAKEGTNVSLVISLGGEVVPTTVPDLSGLTVEKAKAALEREKLKLGETSYAPSDEIEQNLIMDQSVTAGSSVDSGTAVNITLSTGFDESAGAGEVGVTISYSSAKNDVFYLTVMVSDSSGVSTPINYEQRIKSDGSEKFSATGSGTGSIKVYFDNALVQEYSVDFDNGTVD